MSPNRVLFELQSISSLFPVKFQSKSSLRFLWANPVRGVRGAYWPSVVDQLLACLTRTAALLVSGQSWNAEPGRWRARTGTFMQVCHVVWGGLSESVSREICQKQVAICQGVLQLCLLTSLAGWKGKSGPRTPFSQSDAVWAKSNKHLWLRGSVFVDTLLKRHCAETVQVERFCCTMLMHLSGNLNEEVKNSK